MTTKKACDGVVLTPCCQICTGIVTFPLIVCKGLELGTRGSEVYYLLAMPTGVRNENGGGSGRDKS